MTIKASDLPSTPEDARLKTLVLFERRLSRHFASKVKLCVSCYYSADGLLEAYRTVDNVDKVIYAVKDQCISSILQLLEDGTLFNSGVNFSAQVRCWY